MLQYLQNVPLQCSMNTVKLNEIEIIHSMGERGCLHQNLSRCSTIIMTETQKKTKTTHHLKHTSAHHHKGSTEQQVKTPTPSCEYADAAFRRQRPELCAQCGSPQCLRSVPASQIMPSSCRSVASLVRGRRPSAAMPPPPLHTHTQPDRAAAVRLGFGPFRPRV